MRKTIWAIAAAALFAISTLSGCHSMNKASDEAACECATECGCTNDGTACACAAK